MNKTNRHSIELSLDLTTLTSPFRGSASEKSSNFEIIGSETQDSAPVCNNGICELSWKPARRAVA